MFKAAITAKAAQGVILVEHRHTHRPQRFVEKQRSAFNQDGFRQSRGNPQAAVGAHNEGVINLMPVRDRGYDSKFYKAGDHGRVSRAVAAKRRKPELSVDHDVV